MKNRRVAAAALFLLSPLIAEYLLGSLSFGQMFLFPVMALMYGAGALVIREWSRRFQRGWPTMLVLGLAYALIEEGLATQSLFNPHYLGLRLLDNGFIPVLGIGGPWTVYVIILHVGWSVAVPVGLVEALTVSELRTAPWLRWPGLIISTLVYGAGVGLVAMGTWKNEHFLASSAQLGTVAFLAVVIVGLAFAVFRNESVASLKGQGGMVRRPLWFGTAAFVTGSLFHLTAQLGSKFLAPAAQAGLGLALPICLVWLVNRVRRNGGWTSAHVDALAVGGVLAYCWLGFFLVARLHGVQAVPGQIFPCTVVLGLLVWNYLRNRRRWKGNMNAV